MLTKFSEKTRVVAGSHARHLPINLTHRTVPRAIILIMDADGQAVVLYQYDAWGNITQCFDGTEENLAAVNPILYRSYYYDAEMSMYYLNLRYYVPTLCRFLNADGYTQTGQGLLDKNMFAYCGNNPVKQSGDGSMIDKT